MSQVENTNTDSSITETKKRERRFSLFFFSGPSNRHSLTNPSLLRFDFILSRSNKDKPPVCATLGSCVKSRKSFFPFKEQIKTSLNII